MSITVPVAYFITFRSFGTWLHGDKRGSVDRDNNQINTPFLLPNKNRHNFRTAQLSQSPVILDDWQRSLIMLIAKIIKSNSHVDYSARILDSMETGEPPTVADYYFGQFVKVTVEGIDVTGVIYNSQLINPEYGNYGPRLSTPNELNAVFSPDYLNEQGVMIGILFLGWADGQGSHQRVPRLVLPINSHVETLSVDEVRAFHSDAQGALHLSYYPEITTHAGAFSYPLLDAIIDQLEELTTERERTRLSVLRRALAWQQTVGGIK